MSSPRAQSIKARLLTLARERGEEFELFLVRYVTERFLYRLGMSEGPFSSQSGANSDVNASQSPPSSAAQNRIVTVSIDTTAA